MVNSARAAVLGMMLTASTAAAVEGTVKRFAVLEFTGDKRLQGEELQLLSDQARAGALSVLPRGKYLVMTRESIANMLRSMGKSVDACANGECEVDILQNIQADYGITGTVVRLGGSYVVTLKMFDVAQGALLQTDTAKAKDVETLLDEVRKKSAQVVKEGLALDTAAAPGPPAVPVPAVVETGPRVKPSRRTEAVSDLTVDVKPREGARLELTPPGGTSLVTGSPYKNSAAVPGRWRVVASAAGYQAEERVFTVPPDDTWVERLELKRPGGLVVAGSPAGAAVTVTGPGGFRSDDGALPWEAEGLKDGSYHVEVSRKGYAAWASDVDVRVGETARVEVVLKREGQGGKECDGKDVKDCAAQCQAGNAASCFLLGEAQYYGKGVAKDLGAAAQSYVAACRGGHALGCANEGYVFRDGVGVAVDRARAAEAYRKACDAGERQSCCDLGRSYEGGLGVPKDEARAAQLYRKSCDAGFALGCNNLGAFLELGRGVAKDEVRATQLYRTACDGGVGLGCNNLGEAHFYGRGVAKDLATAALFYKKACDAGYAKGCVNQGYMNENGMGVPQDDRLAAETYKKGCDGGDALGCNNLGARYQAGKGVEQDDGRAAQLFQQSCTGGEANGCRNLGLRYEKGLGVPKDLARATQLYEQACGGNNALGCRFAWINHRDGLGVPQDAAVAATWLKKACDLGNQDACAGK